MQLVISADKFLDPFLSSLFLELQGYFEIVSGVPSPCRFLIESFIEVCTMFLLIREGCILVDMNKHFCSIRSDTSDKYNAVVLICIFKSTIIASLYGLLRI